MRRGQWVPIGFCAALSMACGEGTPAGRTDRELQSSDAAGTEHTKDAGGSGLDPDAVAEHPVPEDAASDTPASDAAPPRSTYDGPAPPPHCVAPCIWDVVKHCVPDLGACTEEVMGLQTIRCDASTGWGTVSSQGPSGSFSSQVYAGSTLCYDVHILPIVSPWGGIRTPSGYIAWMLPDETQVICSDATSPIELLDPNSLVTLREGLLAYDHAPDSEDCAGWSWTGRPVSAQCETTTPGECPDIPRSP